MKVEEKEMKDLQTRDVLIFFALKYGGDWDKCVDAIRNHETMSLSEYEELKQTNQSKILTMVDDEYPDYLKGMMKPPLVLFYYGDISILQEQARNVGYVGSRDASKYGKETARSICKELASKGYNIISGLAHGIDTEATLGALEGKGKAVAVLGNGIDYCYPSENTPIYKQLMNEGLIISEYPGMTQPTRETFPFRNRLIACLSKGIIVGEASRRSGTLITVNYALSNNIDVGCVPYHSDENSACNVLIKEGAFMIENAGDAMLMIGEHKTEKERKNFT